MLAIIHQSEYNVYIKAVIGRSSKPKPFREQTVGESLYGFAYEMHP